MLTIALLLAAAGPLPPPGPGRLEADTGRYTRSGLWYTVSGTGPAVVLVHGANLDSRSLAPLAAELAPGWRVVVTDLRLHGRSRDGGGPFSFEGDLLEVLDAAGVGRATLIGHSLGAQVAIDVALARPERVERLVLIGPAISGLPLSRPPAGFEDLLAAIRRGDFSGAGAVLAGMPVMALFRDTTRQGDVRTIVGENTRLLQADRSRLEPLGPPAYPRLAELAVPTLVLTGSRDPTESNAAARELLARVAGATGETFEGCGHLVPLDCPAETRRAVLAFLRDTPRSP